MRKIMQHLWLLLSSFFAMSCKENMYFEWMRFFEQTWFSIDTKMMRNFEQKIYNFIETLSLNETPKKTLNISGPFNFYFYLGV